MKRQAALGQWKTPPNFIYAQDAADHQTPPPPPPPVPPIGTKMQLMGLVQKKSTPTSSSPMTLTSSAFAVIPQPPPAIDAMMISDDAASGKAKKSSLEHSRNMARLRRQQQRVLTDTLESEFLELSFSSAYLKEACVSVPLPTATHPLTRAKYASALHEGIQAAMEVMTSNMPPVRAHESRTTPSPATFLPQAHEMPALRMNESSAIHLAVAIGSRRESQSFSIERRKRALEWAAAGVKDLFSNLMDDALPGVVLGKLFDPVAVANDPNLAKLQAELGLNSSQIDQVKHSILPNLQLDLLRLLGAQRATDILLSENWLALPKTDTIMMAIRDTITTEQLNKLIAWSIVNEAQIASLKLGSVTPPVATTLNSSASSASGSPMR